MPGNTTAGNSRPSSAPTSRAPPARPTPGRPGAALVAPTLILIDDRGRQLALNGTPCGFDGEGPGGTARILIEEGLLTERAALPAITSRHQLTVHRTATAPQPGVLPDATALDLAHLQVRSAQQRWREACSAVDPRLPTDPHYPALAAALDGVDAQAALALVAEVGRLPDADPGWALRSRLTATCDAAGTPAQPPAPGGPAPTAPTDRQDSGRSTPDRTGPERVCYCGAQTDLL